MSKLLLVIFLTISSIATYAQKDKDIPAFGKVDIRSSDESLRPG